MDAPFKDAADTVLLPAQCTGLFLCFGKFFFSGKSITVIVYFLETAALMP
jgi:hypothetical protein